jgi:hypothetical protein
VQTLYDDLKPLSLALWLGSRVECPHLNELLESLLLLPKSKRPSQSLATPFADRIYIWAVEGIQIITTIL